MEITTTTKVDAVEISARGIIVSIDDSSRVKDEIIKQSAGSPGKDIKLIIEDSYLIPSSLIGALLKMIHENKTPISVITKNEQLYYLVQRLKLTDLLNVTQG